MLLSAMVEIQRLKHTVASGTARLYVQGLRRIAAEDQLTFRRWQIQFHDFLHRFEVTHPHWVVRADHDPVRTDDFNEVLQGGGGMDDGIEVKLS
jgi:hypothetical protein